MAYKCDIWPGSINRSDGPGFPSRGVVIVGRVTSVVRVITRGLAPIGMRAQR